MVKLRVNGQEQSFDGDPQMPLLWYLRDELGLTGTKFGCGAALCGACAVDAKGKLTVPRVDTAIDCGFAANPERIYSQIEGAATMGLSLAKYGEISFKNGRVEQNNFDGFPVVRIDEAPQITHVHIAPAALDVPSSGVGEPGLPPFTPALCNAIFAATGKRIRRLPIGNQLAT
jgi:isoquinoline 1-oxidoreductase beta subunit